MVDSLLLCGGHMINKEYKISLSKKYFALKLNFNIVGQGFISCRGRRKIAVFAKNIMLQISVTPQTPTVPNCGGT